MEGKNTETKYTSKIKKDKNEVHVEEMLLSIWNQQPSHILKAEVQVYNHMLGAQK